MVTVLKSVTVNYAPDNFVHNIDGSPIAVDLKLDFQETSTLDRDKFNERVTPYGNEGTQSREDLQEGGSTVVTADDSTIAKKQQRADKEKAAAEARAKAIKDAEVG